jgi:hypothetical protein
MASTISNDKQHFVLSVDNMTPITIISTEKTSFHSFPISIGKDLNITYFTNIDIITKISPVIRNCIEDTYDDMMSFPLAKINEDEFKLLMEYAEKEIDYEITMGAEKSQSINEKTLNQWELAFFNIPIQLVFKLIIAANFLNYKTLLERTSIYFASIIQQTDPTLLRNLFHGDIVGEEEKELLPAATDSMKAEIVE